MAGNPTKPNYAGLGTGSGEGRLGFRLVLGLLWRRMGLLRPVRWHVVLLILGYGLLGAVMLPVVLVFFDLFWNRALLGEPITDYSAASLGLDPAFAVEVDSLGADTRRVVARQSIVYLDLGRVLERGTHDELLQVESGAYRRFVELQTRGAA